MGADVTDEVDDAPPAVPLLNMFERERRHLGPAQPAVQEHRQDRLQLAKRQPVPGADSLGADTFYPRDARSQRRGHQSVVGGLDRQLPDGWSAGR